MGDPARRAEARALADEIVRIGNAELRGRSLSVRIEEGWADEQLARTDTMGPYAPSTLVDARAGRAIELDAMFLEPLRRARRLGVDAPHLTRIAEGLAQRDARVQSVART